MYGPTIPFKIAGYRNISTTYSVSEWVSGNNGDAFAISLFGGAAIHSITGGVSGVVAGSLLSVTCKLERQFRYKTYETADWYGTIEYEWNLLSRNRVKYTFNSWGKWQVSLYDVWARGRVTCCGKTIAEGRWQRVSSLSR